MVNRDDELPREGERPQFDAYDGTGDEHGEPREFRYGSGFDKPERGRWAGQEREEIFTRPYDDWSSPGYVFYAGKGYHREFVDPYAGSAEPEAGAGGRGWQIARERSEEHTAELESREKLVCRLLLEKKKKKTV